MHIYISGVGAGTGPLAVLAAQAGHTVSASDKQSNEYVDYVSKHGVSVHIGQTEQAIQAIHADTPIDWLVYSSAVAKENAQHPELAFAKQHSIRTSKRDEFLQYFLEQTGQRMIAVAGTHGKSTTTAMAVWLSREIGLPVSYLIGAKVPFAEASQYSHEAAYFIYEADEYDRNFLSFTPAISIITGVSWDHPDIYPTQAEYTQAFLDFSQSSERAICWDTDMQSQLRHATARQEILKLDSSSIPDSLQLVGQVNRNNAWQVIQSMRYVDGVEYDEQRFIDIMNQFPGVSRRFEQLAPNIYSDYAHTPEKIRGAIQIAQETVTQRLVVVYEGLHNTRQHFIKDQLADLFAGTNELYVVPSYRAREDESLEDLTPEKLCQLITEPQQRHPMQLDDTLKAAIDAHANNGDLVLCLSAGGGDSLDAWLRVNYTAQKP